MIYLLTQFVLALFATLAFSVIFRVPVKKIPACMVVGALGWITYIIAVHYMSSPIVGCFAGACTVGLLSAICAKVFKEASTVFVIPGILCLVPGYKIYSTMVELLQEDVTGTAQTGLETLLMAGAIAVGLLVMGIIIGLVRILVKKVQSLTARQ